MSEGEASPVAQPAAATAQSVQSGQSPSRRKRPHNPFPPTARFELDRILTIDEVVALSGLSRDTIRRHHSHLIRRLSPRRLGIRLGDALSMIGGGVAA
jgi:hypothetical protein